MIPLPSTNEPHRTERKTLARLQQYILETNLVLSRYRSDVEFALDVCHDGFIHLIQCTYHDEKNFPKIEVLDRLSPACKPPYMIAIPLEFALERAIQSLSQEKRGK